MSDALLDEQILNESHDESAAEIQTMPPGIGANHQQQRSMYSMIQGVDKLAGSESRPKTQKPGPRDHDLVGQNPSAGVTNSSFRGASSGPTTKTTKT